ncbi:hypothetical protein FJ987_16510 [Mesorhizobium sp. CU2]|uniref:SCO family protein n=1 Tax=unclassified Mesorhizobium TaxID=325217 RepID=UPI00112ED1B6|nr:MULTISPECIES: SCO family protein [unclassified Mesorhizobium]TPN82569.1 hypothetical protein FJ988_15560 [Mesorhizobium sp. CU3]TPO12774.1 hypothetical protein FJ987_16510 [Mesorhizobium sp. CU2]
MLPALDGPLNPDDLIAMLSEGHSIYCGRGSAEAENLRAHVMVRAAKVGIADRIVDYAMADLETARSAISLAAAAMVLREAGTAPAGGLTLLAAAHRRLSVGDRLVDLVNFPPGPGGVSASGEISRTLDELTGRARSPAPTLNSSCCCGPDLAEEAVAQLPDLVRLGSLPIETQDGLQGTLGNVLGNGAGLLAFFYTRCMNPLRCSHTVSQLGELARSLTGRFGAEQVRLLGITYDPAYDTAGRLLAYGRDRSVPFGAGCQLLRTVDAFAPVAEALQLGVGYGPATVNQHRLEWIVFAPGLRAVRVGRGSHWGTAAMADDLLLLANGQGSEPSAPGRFPLAPPEPSISNIDRLGQTSNGMTRVE